MKTPSCFIMAMLLLALSTSAQSKKSVDVPGSVKEAFAKKYPDVKGVTWEKEKANFEANWGGKSGEDHSALFNPGGDFMEIVDAMPVTGLQEKIRAYVKSNYPGKKITEAGKGTYANGKLFYEAEVNHKDLVFDDQGNFVKKED